MARLQFPDINYAYWAERNIFFSDEPLSQTIRIGLNHVSKAGLVGPLLKKYKVKTNSGLVDLIKNQIKNISICSAHSDKDLLAIFDLIQGWGGRMGRGPYCKPKGSPVRMHWNQLPLLYREAVECCDKENYEGALQKLLKIKYIGESFATKHIYFWSAYGSKGRVFPIYDTRIKTLLFFDSKTASGYDNYVAALEEKAKELAMGVEFVERALFAFSQNYFGNGSLKISGKVTDNNDLAEASRLQACYLRLNALKN